MEEYIKRRKICGECEFQLHVGRNVNPFKYVLCNWPNVDGVLREDAKEMTIDIVKGTEDGCRSGKWYEFKDKDFSDVGRKCKECIEHWNFKLPSRGVGDSVAKIIHRMGRILIYFPSKMVNPCARCMRWRDWLNAKWTYKSYGKGKSLYARTYILMYGWFSFFVNFRRKYVTRNAVAKKQKN